MRAYCDVQLGPLEAARRNLLEAESKQPERNLEEKHLICSFLSK